MKISSSDEMMACAAEFAHTISPPVCIELIGDVGAGKTTFMKGLVRELGCTEEVQSPSFTIMREYDAFTMKVKHFDFYRLSEGGVMMHELESALNDEQTITAVEWAETVDALLPEERVVVKIDYCEDIDSREVTITHNAIGGDLS